MSDLLVMCLTAYRFHIFLSFQKTDYNLQLAVQTRNGL